MKNYKNTFFTIFSIQIALGTLFYLLFEHFRHTFIVEFPKNPFFNFIRLLICFSSIALWIVSVSYLNMISSKALLIETERHKTRFLIYKATIFLKHSFVVAIVSFFVLYL